MLKRSLLALVAPLLLSGLATAQYGPDVITWRIASTLSNYTDINHYAAANGKDAYSFCTISCNVGTATLLWESGGSVRHPVIAQNMFRLKNGRFEQLGQSFLKHGFCALSQSGCGSCQATPCSTLGIGCADTYGSGLNDGAGGGRKSQVNATRGYHSHPYSSPSGTDPNRGRLQVYTAEIDQQAGDNASGDYFIEGQYVTEDDHLNANAANNASWRKVNVQSNEDLALISGEDTNIEPAIYAWQHEDPQVVIQEVLNISEGGGLVHGYYYVAYRVTDNFNGTWTYSYAVQNLNSDDAGYSFAVPADSGATLTDVWFTDVEYHSGEPFSNTDWAFTQAGGWARWACTENSLQNPLANALRWGTLYSFGFTADKAPDTCRSELTLFTSGEVLTCDVIGAGPGVCLGTPFCFGDGTGVFCPCGNFSPLGGQQGCTNGLGLGAFLLAGGDPSVSADTMILNVNQAAPGDFGIFVQNVATQPGFSFYNGAFCLPIDAHLVRHYAPPVVMPTVTNAVGYGESQQPMTAGDFLSDTQPGVTVHYQYWYRDNAGPCGMGANFSSGLSITWLP